VASEASTPSGGGQLTRKLTISATVALAVVFTLAYLRYEDAYPNTKDAYVTADIIQIVPQVSGPILELLVEDNQRVSAGDVLFRIDPRPFRIAVDAARAKLDKTGQGVSGQVDTVAVAEAALERSQAALRLAEIQYRRVQPLAESGALPMQDRDKAQARLDEARSSLKKAEASLTKARDELGELGERNADTRSAMAALENADLQLEYTTVTAPADGLVTQLQLVVGSYARAGSPALALVDTSTWRVVAYMREDRLRGLEPGQPARIYLPAYPDARFAGVVQGIGWGIGQQDGATGPDGLPRISPTVDWVRLAQRFPVRITLLDLDPARPLRRGMSADVRIDKTGAASGDPG